MKKSLIIAMSLFSLFGCSKHSDLQEWVMNTQNEAAQRKIKKELPEPIILEEYNPPAYTGLNAFDPARLRDVKNNDSTDANAPNLNRAKEVLENYDLDSLEYVGSLIKNNAASAYVRVDGYVYTVNVGNYLGSNFGKVIKIESDKLILEESIEDADGQWEKRETNVWLSGLEANE